MIWLGVDPAFKLRILSLSLSTYNTRSVAQSMQMTRLSSQYTNSTREAANLFSSLFARSGQCATKANAEANLKKRV